MNTIAELIRLADSLDKKGHYDASTLVDNVLQLQHVSDTISKVFRVPEGIIDIKEGHNKSQDFFISSLIGVLQPDNTFIITYDEQFPGGREMAQKFKLALELSGTKVVDISKSIV